MSYRNSNSPPVEMFSFDTSQPRSKDTTFDTSGWEDIWNGIKIPSSQPTKFRIKRRPHPELKRDDASFTIDTSSEQYSECPKCFNYLPLRRLRVHLSSECSENIVTCPEHSCGLRMPSEHLKVHLKRECIAVRRRAKLVKASKQRHDATLSQGLSSPESYDLFPVSYDFSPSSPLPDPPSSPPASASNESHPIEEPPAPAPGPTHLQCSQCDEFVPVKVFYEHQTDFCAMRLVYCSNRSLGCMQEVPLRHMEQHIKENCAPEKRKQVLIARSKMRREVITCTGCGEAVPFIDLKKHDAEECINRKVPCRNEMLGCNVKVRMRDRKLHEYVDGKAVPRPCLYFNGGSGHVAINEDDITPSWTMQFWIYRPSVLESGKSYLRECRRLCGLFYEAAIAEHNMKQQLLLCKQRLVAASESMHADRRASKGHLLGQTEIGEITVMLANLVTYYEDTALICVSLAAMLKVALNAALADIETLRILEDRKAESVISELVKGTPCYQPRAMSDDESTVGDITMHGELNEDATLDEEPVQLRQTATEDNISISRTETMPENSLDRVSTFMASDEKEVNAVENGEATGDDNDKATELIAEESSENNDANDDEVNNAVDGGEEEQEIYEEPNNANDDEVDDDGEEEQIYEEANNANDDTKEAIGDPDAVTQESQSAADDASDDIPANTTLETLLSVDSAPLAENTQPNGMDNVTSDETEVPPVPQKPAGITVDTAFVSGEVIDIEALHESKFTEELEGVEPMEPVKVIDEEIRKLRINPLLFDWDTPKTWVRWRELVKDMMVKLSVDEQLLEEWRYACGILKKTEDPAPVKSPKKSDKKNKQKQRKIDTSLRVQTRLQSETKARLKLIQGSDLLAFSEETSLSLCLDGTDEKGANLMGHIGFIDAKHGKKSFYTRIPREKWTHLCIVCTTEPFPCMSLYSDGLMVGAIKDFTYNLPMQSIGAPNLSYIGYILDIRYWSRPRSVQEVRIDLHSLVELLPDDEPKKLQNMHISDTVSEATEATVTTVSDADATAANPQETSRPITTSYIAPAEPDITSRNLIAWWPMEDGQLSSRIVDVTEHRFANVLMGKYAEHYNWIEAETLLKDDTDALPISSFREKSLCPYEVRRFRLAMKGRALYRFKHCPQCNVKVKGHALRSHMKNECTKRLMKCRFDFCGAEFPVCNQVLHETTLCAHVKKRSAVLEQRFYDKATCPLCAVEVKLTSLERHMTSKCQYRVIPCPNKGCSEKVSFLLLKDHMKFSCCSPQVKKRMWMIQRARGRQHYPRPWGIEMEYTANDTEESPAETAVDTLPVQSARYETTLGAEYDATTAVGDKDNI